MAFIPATQLEAVEALYIGYFGRAGEPGGVQFWIDQLQAGQTFAQVAAAFSVQLEAKAQHPFLANPDLISPSDFVESLYVQLLGRASDAAGKAYWVAQLTAASGNAFSIGILIAQFISGAQGDDVTVLQNKVDAAEYFTGKLAAAGITGTDSKGQVTPQVDAAATDVVSGVTKDPASVTAANAKTDAFVAGGAGGGSIFTFTNQVDNLNGTPGADTFIGDNTSTSAADTANGGSGNDTVKLFGLTGALLPQMNSIENVFISANTAASNFNVSGIAGVTNLELNNVFTGTTGTVGAGQSVKLSNNQGTTVNVAPTAAVTSLNLNLDTNGTTGGPTTVNVGGAALATLNLTGSGGASVIANNFNGGALKTLNIDGGAKVTLQAALTGVTTIDASKATAGTSVVIDPAIAVKFVGGAGADTVFVAGVTSADSIDGAGGVADILGISAGITAANATGIKGFDILQVSGAVTQDIDALIANNALTAINTSNLAGQNIDLVNVNAGAINNITWFADNGDLRISGKGFIAGGISDTVGVTLSDSAATSGADISGNFILVNADVLNLRSLSTDGISGLSGDGNQIGNLNAADLDVLNITGDESVAIFGFAGSNSLTVIDASTNTGGISVDLSLNAIASLNVKGSQGVGGTAGTFNDTINVSNAATGATVQGNKGGDTITLESTVADVLKYLAGDSSTGTTATFNNFDTVTGFLSAGASTIDVSGIGGFTGSQATVLDRSGVAANPNVTAATLAVNAAAAANWFVDLGNINRGVVVVDLDGTGGANFDFAVYVDSNHNGALDTGDLAIRVNAAGAAITATEFTFA